MSEREIRIFGDPVLKTSCREVVELESVNQLVEDLLDTCSIPGRAGVAANQIGVDLRVFSYRVDGELGYLINPVITDFSEETELMEEGCLSVPGLWKTVLRSTSVGVKGSQLDGSEIAIQAEGLLAQVFQHECDHLDGVLYIDRLDKESKKTAMSEIRNSDWFL
ncbi:MAG: peptide deformylase [Microbacteriaceae bacterium]|nr:peptide deformylase [Microbacteriaceae bacterium]MDR9443352.1 peptide deformylase [Microbacteriaceae bacterium]